MTDFHIAEKNVRAIIDEIPRGGGASAAKGRDAIGREQLVAKILRDLGYERKIAAPTHASEYPDQHHLKQTEITFQPLTKEERIDRINPGWRLDRPTPIDQPQIRGLVDLALSALKQRR